MWLSWCHCFPIISASVKSRVVYHSGTRLPRLSWTKRPLSECCCICYCRLKSQTIGWDMEIHGRKPGLNTLFRSASMVTWNMTRKERRNGLIPRHVLHMQIITKHTELHLFFLSTSYVCRYWCELGLARTLYCRFFSFKIFNQIPIPYNLFEWQNFCQTLWNFALSGCVFQGWKIQNEQHFLGSKMPDIYHYMNCGYVLSPRYSVVVLFYNQSDTRK